MPDFLRIDQLSAQIFSDQAVLDEGLTVSVRNGAGNTLLILVLLAATRRNDCGRVRLRIE